MSVCIILGTIDLSIATLQVGADDSSRYTTPGTAKDYKLRLNVQLPSGNTIGMYITNFYLK